MTNHHCARAASRTSRPPQDDYIAERLLRQDARTRSSTARDSRSTSSTEISDVTGAGQRRRPRAQTGEAFNQAQKAEMAAIEKECATGGPDVRCEVVTLYHGGVYNLYKYRRFEDVRLVFAPEEQIAFFGGDPDNFMFPRYDLDVSFLRVYEDGKPRSPSTTSTGRPAGRRTASSPSSPAIPGRTERELTVAQLEYERDVALPRRLACLAELRGMLDRVPDARRRSRRASRTPALRRRELPQGVEGPPGGAGRQDAFSAKKVAEEKALRARIDADAEAAEPSTAAPGRRLRPRSQEAARPRHALHLPRARARLLSRACSRTPARWSAPPRSCRSRTASACREFIDRKLPALEAGASSARRPSTTSSRSRP